MPPLFRVGLRSGSPKICNPLACAAFAQDGSTPLMRAAQQNHVGCADVLIEAGAMPYVEVIASLIPLPLFTTAQGYYCIPTTRCECIRPTPFAALSREKRAC